MGLSGVRTPDNKVFFDAISPLSVVYFDVDYEHNAKGIVQYIDHNTL